MDNINAKLELLSFLENCDINLEDIVCAKIHSEINYSEHKHYFLKKNHTKEELNFWLDSLDFKYDSGYGSQKLFGTIWLKDSQWLTREYDGSEWWEYNRFPEIPEKLL